LWLADQLKGDSGACQGLLSGEPRKQLPTPLSFAPLAHPRLRTIAVVEQQESASPLAHRKGGWDLATDSYAVNREAGLNEIVIGIMSQQQIRARALAVVSGKCKPKPGEPKVWFTSMKSVTEVLSDSNRVLLKVIRETQPEATSGDAVRLRSCVPSWRCSTVPAPLPTSARRWPRAAP
jgi:hypothetical protein